MNKCCFILHYINEGVPGPINELESRNWKIGIACAHNPSFESGFPLGFVGLNPLTPISDGDRISPYNIDTMSSRQVMRI